MTRFAIDAETALRVIADERAVAASHSLVAPAVLRSHALELLYARVRSGQLPPADARRLRDGLATLRIRLLGDRVSRATAWTLAEQRDWPVIGAGEYLAVATLQADALIAAADEVRSAAAGVVALAEYEALFA